MPTMIPQFTEDRGFANASFSSRAVSRTAGSGRWTGAGSVIMQPGAFPERARFAAPGARGPATVEFSQAVRVAMATVATALSSDVRFILPPRAIRPLSNDFE